MNFCDTILNSSILDDDIYKFRMQNLVLKLFPKEIVRYEFFNRDNRPFPEGFGNKLKELVNQMQYLSLGTDEYDYLCEDPYFDRTYCDFLRNYRFDPNEVKIEQFGAKLFVIVEGYWYRTILWEVRLMYLISELYFQDVKCDRNTQKEINIAKAKRMVTAGIHFIDFGSRRRFSRANHEQVLEDIISVAPPEFFLGTSNVYFAKRLNLKYQGTQAHELYSLIAAIYGFIHANTVTMDSWLSVYNGALGIVLPDTFMTNNFLHSFTEKYAKIFDGARQDSGIPLRFADKFELHYKELGIDPKDKKIIFSDSLTDHKAIEIEDYASEKFQTGYGIGTFLTNDIQGAPKPLNIVIKLIGRLFHTKWISAIKLSDDPGKSTGNSAMVSLCRETFRLHYLDEVES